MKCNMAGKRRAPRCMRSTSKSAAVIALLRCQSSNATFKTSPAVGVVDMPLKTPPSVPHLRDGEPAASKLGKKPSLPEETEALGRPNVDETIATSAQAVGIGEVEGGPDDGVGGPGGGETTQKSQPPATTAAAATSTEVGANDVERNDAPAVGIGEDEVGPDDGVARGSPPSDPLLCNDEPGASNESGQKPSSLEEIEDLNRRIDSQCQEGLEDILGDAGLVNDDAALENENYDLEAFLADLFIPELDTSAEQDAAPGEREASANDGSAAVWHDINPQE